MEPRDAVGTGRSTLLGVIEEQAVAVCRSEQRVCRDLARGVVTEMEPVAYSVLSAVRMLGPCRVTDLAGSLGMGKPAISGHVAALQRLGLVTREPADDDERSRPVTLTAEGLRRVDRARTGRKQFFRRQLAGWEPSDVVDLAVLLSRFNEAYLGAVVPDVVTSPIGPPPSLGV